MAVLSDLFFRTVPKLHIGLYRATGGLIGSRMGKVDMLLLTTTGRKSGLRRTSPLLFIEDDHPDHPGCLVIVGSKAGAPKHPAWYLNLQSDPAVTVQVKREVRTMTAETVSEEDKARLWPRLTASWPAYDSYQRKTERPIPVIRLTPR